MTIKKKDLHRLLSTQQVLFDTQLSEGDLDVSLAFRDAVSKALRRTNVSRYQIAGRISELSRHNVSKDMLDKITSSNLDYGLRAEDLPALIMATGSVEPAEVLLNPLGYEIVSPEEGDYVRIARLEKQRSQLDAEIAKLRTKAGIKPLK